MEFLVLLFFRISHPLLFPLLLSQIAEEHFHQVGLCPWVLGRLKKIKKLLNGIIYNGKEAPPAEVFYSSRVEGNGKQKEVNYIFILEDAESR